MRVFTITVSSKGQITVPAPLRCRLGLTTGAKVEVFPLDRQRFTAQVRRPSRILDFAGDLQHLDRHPDYHDQDQDKEVRAA